MSSNSIRAYQERYGKPVALQDRISALASRTRRVGASLLAIANELDDLVNELQPGQPGEPEQPVPACYCGELLTFYQSAPELCCVCYCKRCEKRAQTDGVAVLRYGHGKNNAAAFADWQKAMENS